MAQKKKVVARKKTKPEVVQPAVIETTFSSSAVRFVRLRLVNFVLAGAYALQGVALVVFMHAASLPVTLGYLVRDPLQSAAQGSTVLTPATHEWFILSVTWLVAVMLWVMALGRLAVATSWRQRFETGLEQGGNQLRWLTQAVSLSLLFLTLGLLAGVQDVALLAALVVSMLVLHLFAALIEKPGKPIWPLRKLHVALGLLAGLLPWAIVTQYLLAAVVYGTAPLTHIWAVYALTTGLLLAYGSNCLLQHRAYSRWADHLFGERVHQAIGLIGLSAFAWLAVATF